VLTQNRISELADLDPLAGFKGLTHLVLLENPVAAKEVSPERLKLLKVWVLQKSLLTITGIRTTDIGSYTAAQKSAF
jgi:hypothetical protein